MLPYIVVFFIAIIATYNAQRSKPNGLLFCVHSIFAIVPLVLLAAFRDYNVGSDTANYMYLFENAVENKASIIRYIYLHSSYEIGFLIYNFIIAQFADTVVSYYIITYGIIITVAYASAFKLRKFISPYIFIFIYVLIFYSESLNGMRQYIAISFILYAVANLLTGRRIKYVIWTLFACLFHTSAIISLTIGGTYWLLQKYPLHNHKFLYMLICLAVLIVAVGMDRFANMGWLPVFEKKLENHLTNTSSGGISNSHIVVCLCTLIVLLFSYKRTPLCDLMVLTTIYVLIFYISPNMNAILYRLTLYFNSMICIAVSNVFSSVRASTKINVILLLFLYIAFYVFSIIISGTHEVIPYTSKILGI